MCMSSSSSWNRYSVRWLQNILLRKNIYVFIDYYDIWISQTTFNKKLRRKGNKWQHDGELASVYTINTIYTVPIWKKKTEIIT